MTKVSILASLVVVVLLLGLPAAVLAQAQPPRPAVFGGTVMSDGKTPADGAMVTAWVDGKPAASTTVMGGMYAMTIAQPPDRSFEGKEVAFMVGDLDAKEKGTWRGDGGGELNLTAITGPTSIGTRLIGLTQILADSKGMTLYVFTRDTPAAGTTAAKSACTSEGCLARWGLVTSVGAPVAGSGATAAFLGTAKHPNGTTQVTYKGWPLYYFKADKAAGDVGGQGTGGVWWVVSPAGEGITGAAMAGKDGAPGAPGAAGAKGAAGAAGAAGDAGAKGAAGATGPKGDKGDPGAAGAKGDAGAAGAAGAAGVAGPAGPKGDSGAAGAGGAGGAGGGGSAVLGIIAIIIAAVALVGALGAMLKGRGAAA